MKIRIRTQTATVPTKIRICSRNSRLGISIESLESLSLEGQRPNQLALAIRTQMAKDLTRLIRLQRHLKLQNLISQVSVNKKIFFIGKPKATTPTEGNKSEGGGDKNSKIEFDRGSTENNNPHNKVIGKKFLSGFKKNKIYIECLKFSEFKDIKFPIGGYPKFAIDFLKYMTLFDIEAHFNNKKRE